ncbi:hypothetical protein LOAG_16160 [Loa loa]|uniref:Uncharacterized protein n=1 Tax=Loa loa TaxID=7209 RepID=A0A1S0TE56_LOALO|nr:hypothetical protein LOAG_16160 [Loa loa]EFO12373.1 hypothetical protein LOAG_16160 [Loa loa]
MIGRCAVISNDVLKKWKVLGIIQNRMNSMLDQKMSNADPDDKDTIYEKSYSILSYLPNPMLSFSNRNLSYLAICSILFHRSSIPLSLVSFVYFVDNIIYEYYNVVLS